MMKNTGACLSICAELLRNIKTSERQVDRKKLSFVQLPKMGLP
jgi:hypothetical protein